MTEAAVAKAESSEAVAENPAWQNVASLPCLLTIDLPVPFFTLGQLAELAKDTVVDSHWNVSDDVPIRVNGELVGWSEFEVVGNKLAVRMTELA